MPRKPPTIATNGHSQIRVPGCYRQTLQRKCEVDAFDYTTYLTASDNPEELAEWERQRTRRVLELFEQRWGKPLLVQSHMLPEIPDAPLFKKFPTGGQRTFIVEPDDTITLRKRTA